MAKSNKSAPTKDKGAKPATTHKVQSATPPAASVPAKSGKTSGSAKKGG